MATEEEEGSEVAPLAEEPQPGPSQDCNTVFHSAEFACEGEQERVRAAGGEPDRESYADLIRSAIEETKDLKKLQDTNEVDAETFLETLPEDCTYRITSLQGTCSRFVASVLTPDLTTDNYKDWLREYEDLNNTCLRKKTVKGETSGYLMQTYYRCQHNTRNWSPSKDPQCRLSSDPTARVKNTNCPFQLVLKISRENVTTITIHCEHNHSIGSLETSTIKDLSKETVEKVCKLYESGLTPSTARQQFLTDLKNDCKDDITYHQRKADRSIMPRKRDFSHLYQQFGKENYAEKDSQMFIKLVERFKSYKEQNPEEEEGPELAPLAEEPQPGPSQESVKKPSGWNTFFNSVAPDVMAELGEGAQIGQVSTVVGKMWKKLPADRRKDWRDEAQRMREDVDTGLVEKKRCASCSASFSRDKDLKYHQKGCLECVCSECDEKFNHKLKLKRHMAKYHRERYKCNHCNKTFSEGRNLTRHQKSHD